jgi:hypothetical protein
MQRTCGDCRFFRTTEERDDSRIGQCRLQKVIGVFRDSMHGCPSFARPGELPPIGATSRRSGGSHRSSGAGPSLASVAVDAGQLAEVLGGLTPLELKATLLSTLTEVQQLQDEELGRAWIDGVMVLQPADEALKPKEIVLDQFLHKLVMIRDNLRVLEQKLNSHKLLQDSERVDLQRRVSLAHVALLRMATGWLPRAEATPAAQLLQALVLEAEAASLALPVPPLGDRWHGGQVVITAGETHVEEPVETFFRRLALLRDRLAALEALLSAHPHLAESDADQMSSYVRRSYGSLTSFNVLFSSRSDYFNSGR